MSKWTHNILTALIDGGAAGAHSLSGAHQGSNVMKENAVLASVIQIDGTTYARTADLTSEFSRTDDKTVDNTAGTDTTGDLLLLTWHQSWD